MCINSLPLIFIVAIVALSGRISCASFGSPYASYVYACNAENCERGLELCAEWSCLGEKLCTDCMRRHDPHCLECAQQIYSVRNRERVSGRLETICSPHDAVQVKACQLYCQGQYMTLGRCSKVGKYPVCQCEDTPETDGSNSTALVPAGETTTAELPAVQTADASTRRACEAFGEGWTLYNSHCYKFFAEPVARATAATNCAEHNSAYLVELNDASEQEAVMGLSTLEAYVSSENATDVWVGAESTGAALSFQWSHDAAPLPPTSTMWCAGQPDNGGPENNMEPTSVPHEMYVSLNMTEGHRCLQDVVDAQKAYVCEIETSSLMPIE